MMAWSPVLVLPLVAGWLTVRDPAWIFMWALAVSIYAGCKWLSFAASVTAEQASLRKQLGYLLLWTGMDADAFFAEHSAHRPRWSQWAWSAWQAALGVWLMRFVAPRFLDRAPLFAGWLAMTGIVSVLHFGLSQFLSLVWRTFGTNAQHIMHKPLLASSLADFWGRRWNLAFRDLMHKFVLRPLYPRVGGNGALLGVFLASGLIHDAVISVAAGAGYGLPTLYFLIQGLAQWFERSQRGRRLGLGRGVIGRAFAVAVILAPVALLFHPPFIRHVVLPMVAALARVP
jgi:alginate O-acetyltransferase complex protein AlgI